MSDRPLVLITNRFDHRLKLLLPQLSDIEARYCPDLFSDLNLCTQAQAVIVRTGTDVDHGFFKKFKNLKYLVTATSGFDHIDLKLAQQNGVRCFHVPESQSNAAAELTILMILASQRKLRRATEQIQKGDWDRSRLLGKELRHLSLGLIGLGRVGSLVAQKAMALGLTVQAFDPYIESPLKGVTMMGFEELMRASDIVSLHVPKTPRTRHMIRRESLSWMSTEASLINLSRGDVINEVDLVEHLRSHPDFSASLDVFTVEPLGADSELLRLPNVFVTPHIGASTEEAIRQSSEEALNKVQSLFKGQAVTGELPPQAPWYEG